MNSVLSYDICALILAVIIIFVSVYQKHFDLLQHRNFIKLSTVLVVCSVFSMEAAYTAAMHGNGSFPLSAVAVFVFVTVAFDTVFPLLFVIYCMSVFDQDIGECKKRVKTALFVPLGVELYLLLFQSGNPTLFTLDLSVPSVSGTGVHIFGFFSLYYVFFALIYSFSFRKITDQSIMVSLILASLFIITGIIMNMFSDDFITGNLLYAMALLIIRMLNQRSHDYIDLMTQIPNGNAFRRCFDLNQKNHRFNELYIIYIENLRLLNLTFGFSKINDVIVSVASYLDKVSDQDAFYLESGTFILMPRLLPSEKKEFFSEIEKRFTQPWKAGEADILVSIRIMEVKLPADADTDEKVYTYADCLRSMKSSLENYFYASEVTIRNSSHVLFLENCIKRALEQKNFKVYYQPIYSTKEKRIISAEALIRLIDPEHGFISPAEFIPVSEENGMILQIGLFVLESVFDFIALNDFKELGLDYVEINLSVVQCMQNDLAATISKMAEDRGVDSICVNLEITETAAAERPLMLMKNMQHLIEQKYTFSLDDFGTGYSNISSMLDMPLEIIKFDKSIIDRLLHNEEGQILVESLAAMVKKMGKKIVAEGVETELQLKKLEEVGVDYIQGYYFSKPLPAEDFLKFVKDFNTK